MRLPHQETLEFYDLHASRIAETDWTSLDLAALREFTKLLSPQARILDAGCGIGRDLHWLRSQGFDAEGFDGSCRMVEIATSRNPGAHIWLADLLLMKLAPNSYDGIWANQSLTHLPAPGWQRALASFFVAMKPKSILFVGAEAGEGESTDTLGDAASPQRRRYRFQNDDIASLLRQNGFQVIRAGHAVDAPDRIGLIARRL